jgi:hypothetical protein
MPRKPQNKEELIKAIEHEWALLINVVESLTDEQIILPDAGSWSPKDNLAHLAEWMNILMGYHMDKRKAHQVIGVPETVTQVWDVEVINPILFERNKDRSHSEVMHYLKSTYQALLTKLQTTSFEELMKPRYADDPKKRPLLLWVLGDTTEHFEEHRKTIQKGIA